VSLDPSLFTRDWHVLDLALERLVLDDLQPAEARKVEAHLATCEACSQRHEAVAAEMAAPLPELAPGGRGVPESSEGEGLLQSVLRLRWFMGGVGATVAAAALALVVLLPRIDDPRGTEFRDRGSELSFEVYRKDAKGAVRVQDGDGVRPGDRLGFRIGSQDDGHLIVLGIDSTMNPYPCYPADPGSGPAPWSSSPDPVQLDAAVELDATPGQERLLALLCGQPVGFDAVAPRLRTAASGAEAWGELPDLYPGCLQRELRVHKLEAAP